MRPMILCNACPWPPVVRSSSAPRPDAPGRCLPPLAVHALRGLAILLCVAPAAPRVLADPPAQAAREQAAAGWQALPEKVTLVGKAARHGVLLHRLQAGELGTSEPSPQWVSDDPQVVRVEQGQLIPQGDGQAEVRAVADGRTLARVRVAVEQFDAAVIPSFRHDVQPLLARRGCNSGACHGALAGKGGFKLSLRGYDPQADYHTLTRQARGRRIELADPARSLLLTKPSGALPHKGGVRFEVDSHDYRLLASWLTRGAPGPADDDPQLVRLEILPPAMLLSQGAQAKLLVRAHFSDGEVRDVTRWAKFTATDQAIAQVDDQGTITVVGPGEGAVTAWYSSKIVVARVTSPYANQVTDEQFAAFAEHNFIDRLVLEKLRRLNLPPSPAASDWEFLRRAHLDTLGVLPTASEARQFLADAAPDKRARLIDSLLARPEFVDYWTYKWSDLLLLNGNKLRPPAIQAFYQWIRGHVAANTPWDQFVGEIVTAQGGSLENGATNFFALHQDPESMTENVSQAFLGLSIGCAKCHNHPLEKWTNDQYYGMANLFARVRAKGWGGDSRNGDGRRTLFVATKGDLLQPLTGKPQPPRPLDGEPLPFDSPDDRRVALARWLTSPENPYFTRAIANRVWANFFGVGLVEAVDDLRESNPASNEQLLQATADYLVEQRYNLKQLMRAILMSSAYQRSSQPLPENRQEGRYYSRYYPRRMMAEVMLDAFSSVTQAPSRFTQIEFPGADTRGTDFYPEGTRALQLYDSAVSSYFLKTFGRNQRRITCECERSDEPSMVQVLHLSNGETVNQKLRAKDNRIDSFLQRRLTNAEVIEELYLLALARYPTDREREELLEVMEEAATSGLDRRTLLEDVFWGVLSSREFLFHH